ncbi:MAG: zinc ribbon domain-containing protein [Nannocystaceae bacterium]|nr:zinc ribbon domain-containing protein [Nannocystaceae bacterium]
MPTEAIRCPTCGAADPSRTDAAGLNTCAYCGVRYRIVHGTPTRVIDGGPAKPGVASGRPVLVAAAAVGVIALGAGVAVGLTRRPPASPPTPTPSPAVPAVVQPIATVPPADPPTSTPPATPEPVVVPATTPVAAPPLTARFELEHRRPAYGSTFYAIGWVTNTSGVTIDRPKITAVMRDAAGAEVGTAFGFAEADVLAAGERSPVSLLVMEPPPFATIDFELRPSAAHYIPPRVSGLRLEHAPPKSSDFGTKITGKIFNEGTEAARFVKILALSYDADGKLASVDSTYADGDSLAPGDSARFELSVSRTEAPIARHELQVSGSPLK